MQPVADLLRDHRLRPGRSAEGRAGLRPDHPGPVRDDEHHRRRGVRAAARRLSGCRHHQRHHRGVRDLERAGAAARHGRGRLHRRLDARLRARHDGVGHLQLPDRRHAAAGARQRQLHRRAVGHLQHQDRPAEHRGQQAGAVRGAGQGDRARRPGHRRALREAREPQAAPRGADRGAREGAARTAGREWETIFNGLGIPAGSRG